MNKKSLIILGAVAIIVTTIIVCFTNKNNLNEDKTKNDLNNELNNTQIENTETKVTNEKFNINLIEDVDHYILNIQTNLIKEPFEFSYDASKFILDSSSSIFDNAVISGDSINKNVKINLESNQLYKINFIKKSSEKMKLGKNLIINE